MAIFPTDDPAYTASQQLRLYPVFPYVWGHQDNVKRASPEAGDSSMLDVWNRIRFFCETDHVGTIVNMDILLAFWKAQRTAFYTVFNWEQESGSDDFVGNGSQDVFTLTAKGVSGVTVTPSQGAFAILSGTGPEGEDQIDFTTAPPNLQAFTVSYFGRNRYTMEFVGAPQIEASSHGRRRIRFQMREKF